MVWVRVSLAVDIEIVIGGKMGRGEMGINRNFNAKGQDTHSFSDYR
jgi:hypothetical protein